MIGTILQTSLETALTTTLAMADPVSGAAHGAGHDDGHGGVASGGALMAIIPLLPLFGAVLVGVLACFNEKSKLPGYATVGILAVAFVCTLITYLGWDGHSVLQVRLWDWIGLEWGDGGVGESLDAGFAFYFDGLSLLWMLFVTGLAASIALYASEYMEHDAGLGYCRFFGAFNLFVFSMSCLVMGDNLLMLFLGWEGVGLCSYLLIGYYYKKKAAVDAGMKAFVVNRIGDLGLLLGTLLTFTTFGSLEYAELFATIGHGSTAAGAPLDATWQVWAIPLLLMMGAFGKSAQLFFYVWLPDAMEGPTPVSALIHAATMVTAGVYLVARMMPLFIADTHLIALTVVTWGGAITAFWAATIAMAQYDIKRIMGYSTISQLGYMFAGLGVLATTGGVFHVFTHAFFKATLFLSCGAVMHGFAGQLDLRKLSGMWKIPGFKIVSIAMLIGCLNLAGFPFTAGYFSKDMILAEAWYTPDSKIWGSSWAGWLMLLTAGLTAYYTFRVFFRVFVGPVEYHPGDDVHDHDDHAHGEDHAHDAGQHGDDHTDHFHPHAPKWAINLVLVVLAGGSVLAAGLYFVGDHHGWAGGMVHASETYFDSSKVGPDSAVVVGLESAGVVDEHASVEHTGDHTGDHGADHTGDTHAGVDHASADHAAGHGDDHVAHGAHGAHGTILGLDPHKYMYYISAVVGFIGIGVAFVLHFAGRTEAATSRADGLAKAFEPVHGWAERKWFVDEFYGFIIVTPLKVASHLFHWFDKLVIDGIVELFGGVPKVGSETLSPATQTGVLHDYALRMVAGVAIVLVVVAIVLY